MLLSNHGILDAIIAGRLKIHPIPFRNIQPASVDLHLGPILLKPKTGEIIDRYGPVPTVADHDEYDLTTQPFRLYPEDFVLVSTYEHVSLLDPSLAAILVGKSTLARDGLQVEAAGYVDPGWIGNLTLELRNLGKNTIILRYEQPICQIRFHLTDQPVSRLYGTEGLGSHYQGATSTQPGFTPEKCLHSSHVSAASGPQVEDGQLCSPEHQGSDDPRTHTSPSSPVQIPLDLGLPAQG